MTDNNAFDSHQGDGVLSDAKFVPRKFRDDLKALQERFDLYDGLVINLTLQDALSFLERDYPKTEAYIGLINWLKRNYGVDLVITSRYYSRKEEKDV